MKRLIATIAATTLACTSVLGIDGTFESESNVICSHIQNGGCPDLGPKLNTQNCVATINQNNANTSAVGVATCESEAGTGCLAYLACLADNGLVFAQAQSCTTGPGCLISCDKSPCTNGPSFQCCTGNCNAGTCQ